MAWLLGLLALLLAPGAHGSGGRLLADAPAFGAPSALPSLNIAPLVAPAPAPTPSSEAPTDPDTIPADMLFLVSSPHATLTADTLELSSAVVQSFTREAKADVYTAAEFANSSAGSKFVAASGQWLDSPVAVLKAIDGSGTKATALLALSEPRYSDAARKLSFKAKMMPATREGSRLSVTSGTAQRVVDDTQNGLAAGAMTAPPADGKLANVALFIDQNSMQLVPEQQAAVERWYCLGTYCWEWGDDDDGWRGGGRDRDRGGRGDGRGGRGDGRGRRADVSAVDDADVQPSEMVDAERERTCHHWDWGWWDNCRDGWWHWHVLGRRCCRHRRDAEVDGTDAMADEESFAATEALAAALEEKLPTSVDKGPAYTPNQD